MKLADRAAVGMCLLYSHLRAHKIGLECCQALSEQAEQQTDLNI